MKIALITERKNPADNRVALTPLQCAALKNRFPFIDIFVESCNTRCFTDDEYKNQQIIVSQNIEEADVLFGIKEIPKEHILTNKTYFIFSHTIKQQPYNQAMLKTFAKNNCTLIDYEMLKWENGQRVLGFGRWAGIVGAYNGLLTWGKRTGAFSLPAAHQCQDYTEILHKASSINLGNIKIVLTGGGRVGTGALEFLRNIRMKEVSEWEFMNVDFNEPVFVHLNSPELYKHKNNLPWNSQHFYANHGEYQSRFAPFTEVCDLLINGIFWTSDLPKLFEKEDCTKQNFNIQVIADISCDEDGSCPLTYKTATIAEPVLGWSKLQNKPCTPFTNESIDIMAVGNLPNELPCDASEAFGEKMLQNVFPEFLKGNSRIIQDATILQNGKLTKNYSYLSDYLEK